MTYALPSLDERRASRVASLAFYAYWIFMGGDLQLGSPMCETCGLGTGNWCDTCENQGRTFKWKGQVMAGKPLCSICDRDTQQVVVPRVWFLGINDMPHV